ncbi:MAG: GRAM domain-containing protein [Bacteroidia bacterium]
MYCVPLGKNTVCNITVWGVREQCKGVLFVTKSSVCFYTNDKTEQIVLDFKEIVSVDDVISGKEYSEPAVRVLARDNEVILDLICLTDHRDFDSFIGPVISKVVL